MPGFDLLITNLLSPIVLAFALGAVAGFIRSELELPEPVLKLISIYLLFSIGLTGGRELAQVPFAEVAPLLAAGVALTLAIPVATFLLLRRAAGFDVQNAAAVAAHYGSVSTVTFFAAVAFARAMEMPAEGFMPAVVALMEWGVIVALLLARISMGRARGGMSLGALAADTLRGRGILLLSGGMMIGALATDPQWRQISPVYEGLFRGVLMIFLLEMGMTAARQMRDFARVGRFLTVFAIASPVVWGIVGVVAGQAIGLSQGGAFVLGAICASASYIDAPAACRAALPEASPGIYLTASLGVTFPFNLLLGLPMYWQVAAWLYR
ncbi:sodium-dependent bicarbonate transport family permease [Neoroseomonas rubea]|uniref:sodium-dependent bicarbonate transport family permease n=1 Tax=Neoroseomonas rubea TaxID=2748666 RepID=UPI0018E026D7|nr:sodium-dependent bicarbonate transport family permease [Roseomonas rubea]